MRSSAVLFAILSGFATYAAAAPLTAMEPSSMGSIFGSALGNPGSANEGNGNVSKDIMPLRSP